MGIPFTLSIWIYPSAGIICVHDKTASSKEALPEINGRPFKKGFKLRFVDDFEPVNFRFPVFLFLSPFQGDAEFRPASAETFNVKAHIFSAVFSLCKEFLQFFAGRGGNGHGVPFEDYEYVRLLLSGSESDDTLENNEESQSNQNQT